MIKPWPKKKQKLDYDCGFFKVLVHHRASPTTGKVHPFYVLSTRNWVNVVALTRDRKVVMVTQFRHGSAEVSLEIPGGAVDHGEPPLKAAKRELREETGYETTRWHFLGKIRPNPAILSNTCYLYLALDARKTAPLELDEAEELEVTLLPLTKIPTLIRGGKICHALVVAAFHYLDLFKKQSPGKI